jgi:hypothetical protein
MSIPIVRRLTRDSPRLCPADASFNAIGFDTTYTNHTPFDSTTSLPAPAATATAATSTPAGEEEAFEDRHRPSQSHHSRRPRRQLLLWSKCPAKNQWNRSLDSNIYSFLAGTNHSPRRDCGMMNMGFHSTFIVGTQVGVRSSGKSGHSLDWPRFVGLE